MVGILFVWSLFMLNIGITKPFKTYEEQVEILKNRGLIIKDVAAAKETGTSMNAKIAES